MAGLALVGHLTVLTLYCHHLPLLTIRCECLNLTGRAQGLSDEEFVPDNSIVNPDTRY